ncbi:hypothetical protein PFAG_03439 [Plasmodium falciparum Santa Lucia]|uniref:Uncharacterized protein n=1 Tax=Plasmodium falciparum Santa Lucia TaxID=478859 RepID=W7FG88_PLAFA|nr:hypothetical protein PFAG_03439 [Plasmodium falciparum Santa Lucia]
MIIKKTTKIGCIVKLNQTLEKFKNHIYGIMLPGNSMLMLTS